MFCTNCGNFNPDGTQNCSSCGAPLTQSQRFVTQNQGNVIGQQTNYQPYEPQQFYGQAAGNQVPVFQQPDSQGVPGKGAGIASLILGIISLASFCIPVFPAVVALVGMILGIVSVSKAGKAGKKCGVGIAGLICSIIGLLIGGIYILGLIGAIAQEISSGTYYY